MKSGTGVLATATASDTAADAKAATKQTEKLTRTHEGNETVLRAMQETKQSKKNEKDIYKIGEEERVLNKLTNAPKGNE